MAPREKSSMYCIFWKTWSSYGYKFSKTWLHFILEYFEVAANITQIILLNINVYNRFSTLLQGGHGAGLVVNDVQ